MNAAAVSSEIDGLHARSHPVLYSFRRCPYAMRAHMGILASGIKVERREILLRDKPAHMVAISPKATVPVLQLPDGKVIDESFDIMLWALSHNDPSGWLGDGNLLSVMNEEILALEDNFKIHLDRYKYPNRYQNDDGDALSHRTEGVAYLHKLEAQLSKNPFLFAARPLLADYAIFPFVRQFANVDRAWFDALPLPHLHEWLEKHLQSDIFLSIMEKYAPWRPEDPIQYFGGQLVISRFNTMNKSML